MPPSTGARPAARARASATVGAGADRIQVVAAPLRKQVINVLREAILSFQYQPGERLVERELGDRFGVSRTVIREALRQLEADGLVDLLPNHGPVVSTTSFDEARAVYEIRESVEALAARYFAERATAAQKRRLQAALRRVEHACQGGRVLDELRANDQFYTVLFEGCDNAVIASTMRSLRNRAQMLRAYSLQLPGRASEALAGLREMVGAIERSDPAAAYAAAAEHVRRSGAIVLKALEALQSEYGPEASAPRDRRRGLRLRK